MACVLLDGRWYLTGEGRRAREASSMRPLSCFCVPHRLWRTPWPPEANEACGALDTIGPATSIPDGWQIFFLKALCTPKFSSLSSRRDNLRELGKTLWAKWDISVLHLSEEALHFYLGMKTQSRLGKWCSWPLTFDSLLFSLIMLVSVSCLVQHIVY